MFRRLHGVDRHKSYSTTSVLNRDGEEVPFLRACSMEEHIKNLGPDAAVVLEASCGSFYCAGRIEATGATCFVLDANRFRNITERVVQDRQAGRTEPGEGVMGVSRHRGVRGPDSLQAERDDPNAA